MPVGVPAVLRGNRPLSFPPRSGVVGNRDAHAHRRVLATSLANRKYGMTPTPFARSFDPASLDVTTPRVRRLSPRIAPLLLLLAVPAVEAATACTARLQPAGPLWSLFAPGMPAVSPSSQAAHAAFGRRLASGDFNHDGRDDLAIAHRQLGIGGQSTRTGAVTVLSGSASGVAVEPALTLYALAVDADNPPGFGERMAAADFNGDGFDDLAVAAPGNGLPITGKVYVFHGGPLGLDPLVAQTWHRDVEGVPGEAGNEDGFGTLLVAGNFDGDAFADLAIAAGRGLEPSPPLRVVTHVFFGSASGLSTTDNTALEFAPVDGSGDDLLPRAALDTDADASDELLITFPPRLPLGGPWACLAHALRTSPGWSCFGQQSTSMTTMLYDPGGVAAGDVDGDGFDDVIAGENGYNPGSRPGAGRARVWRAHGDAVGVIEPEAQFLVSPVTDSAGSSSRFGTNVVVADIDGDTRVDAVIGEPGHTRAAAVASAGMLHVYGGSHASTPLAPVHSVTASAIESLQPLQTGTRLGGVLASGDFDGDGCIDIAAGLPSLDAASITRAGGVVILANQRTRMFSDGFEPPLANNAAGGARRSGAARSGQLPPSPTRPRSAAR
jgi:hypothetical protein